MPSTPNRFHKQQSLVPPEKLQNLAVTIIGLGAIGRQVAIQLACLGVQELQLIDFDIVEPTNITSQGYLTNDLGESKVAATKKYLELIDPNIKINIINDRFRPTQPIHPVIFCCVDSISTRSTIWRHTQHTTNFFADGRMLGETLRILTACDLPSKEHYPTTLFPQQTAQTGSCTAHSTIYTVNIAAGLLVQQFVSWLRGMENTADVILNLNSFELVNLMNPSAS